MEVLVIGGSGVISRAIVRQLVAAGHGTTVFNRGQRKIEYPAGVRQLIGDRQDFAAFEAAMAKHRFDAVIDMISYKVDDARSTLRAFGGRTNHLVFCSTSAVYERPLRTIPTVESGERLWTTPVFPYGYQKAEMERYLLPENGAQPEARGTAITLIRPSLTFGEGSANVGVLRQNYNLVDRLRRGKALISFGDGKAPWTFTFAPDLAQGFVGSLGTKATFGKAYHVCNEDPVVWDDLYRAFGRAVGVEPVIRHIPAELLEKADPQLFGHIAQEKSFATVFDCGAFRRDVPGWKASIGLDQGVGELIAWYQKSGQVVDESKDKLEDRLVGLWEKWAAEISELTPRA